MKLPQNRFKAQLQQDRVSYGLWCGLGNATAAEICACAGFDWLLLDAEHAPLETDALLESLRTIAGYQAAPIVRPISDHPDGLKRLLDIGVQSLLIPMVHTAEQAQAIVTAARYPPKGTRGIGTSLARAARWNMVDNYIAEANDELCIVAQVESLAALHNLTAIASTEGVDGLFVGPSDLGAAMGFPGQSGHPEVIAAVCGAIAAIRRCHKPAGVLATDPVMIKRYVDAGATFVGVGTDTGLLAKSAQTLLASLRPPEAPRA